MTQTQDFNRMAPDLTQWETATREVTWALPGQGDFEALRSSTVSVSSRRSRRA